LAIDGAVTALTTFGTCLPIKTPNKLLVAIRNNKAVLAVIQTMVDQCTGMPIKILKGQKGCATCKSNTSWYCVGCKRWLCIDKKKKEGSAKIGSLHVYCSSWEQYEFTQRMLPLKDMKMHGKQREWLVRNL